MKNYIAYTLLLLTVIPSAQAMFSVEEMKKSLEERKRNRQALLENVRSGEPVDYLFARDLCVKDIIYNDDFEKIISPGFTDLHYDEWSLCKKRISYWNNFIRKNSDRLITKIVCQLSFDEIDVIRKNIGSLIKASNEQGDERDNDLYSYLMEVKKILEDAAEKRKCRDDEYARYNEKNKKTDGDFSQKGLSIIKKIGIAAAAVAIAAGVYYVYTSYYQNDTVEA